METIIELLPILLPIFLLNLAVQIYCVIDIHKEERKVLLMSKTAWTIVVLLINIAWVVYLLAGREQ